MTSFDDIAVALNDGTLTPQRLRDDSITPDDFWKIRDDNPQRSYAAVEEYGARKKADTERTYTYVMSTENPVGFFRESIKVRGWDLTDFKKRSMPFILSHGRGEVPLGRMSNVTKSSAGGQRALIGDATFTPEGMHPVNDLVESMVREGFMPGGSVGFDVLERRRPTPKELEEDKRFNEFSSVIMRAALIEFSSVSVGMDPDAVKIRAEKAGGFDAWLQKTVEEGRFDRDVAAKVRHEVLGMAPVLRGYFSGTDLTALVETEHGDTVDLTDVHEQLDELRRDNEHLQERIASLEDLAESGDDGEAGGDAAEPKPDLFDLYEEAFG